MTDESFSEDRPATSWPLLLLLGAVVLLWGLSWYAVERSPLTQWSERGQFGDMFGAVNSLFSGLAFAGVVYTIFLQRNELALQREEMRRARAEAAHLARSSDLSARLAALSQLIQHYGSLIQAWQKQAIREIPDANAPGGRRIVVVDQQANDQLGFVLEKYNQCIGDFEHVYEAVSGIPGLGSGRFTGARERGAD